MSSQPTHASHVHTPERRAPRRSGGLPIHVLLVDDHPAVRLGIRGLIGDQPDLAMIAEAASATEAVGELGCWADVAIIDYHLGGRDGLWLTGQLKQRPRSPRVLIYSAFADHALAVAAMIAGADGILPKHALDQELCVAVRRLARGRQHFPAIPAPFARALRSRLEPRDQAIYDHLLRGAGPRELLPLLGITAPELWARRQTMLRTLAPNVANPEAANHLHTRLDYDRARRRRDYRAA